MGKKDTKDKKNHHEREKRETSVEISSVNKKVEEQLKEAEENKEVIAETIDFIEMYLEHFDENYDKDHISIEKKDWKNLREKYKEELEEVKSIMKELNEFLEDRSDKKKKKNEPANQTKLAEDSSGLEEPVSELEKLSELSSSSSLAKEQGCFLKDYQVDEIRDLVQENLSNKDLIREIRKLGDIKAQIKEREEFKILIVKEKKGERECKFKIS